MIRLPLFERLDLGDHICWTVDDDLARLRALIDVMRTGFREGHRALYFGADTGQMLATLGRLGLRVDEVLASGDLRVLPIESCWLTAGVFDHAAALRFLRREIDDARRAGHRGLRLLTDMSWVSRAAPGLGGLSDYECQVNTILAEGYALAVCAYAPTAFEAPVLRELAQAHLGTVPAGHPFDPATVLRVRRTEEPFGLRLEGEADLMNMSALRAVVDRLLDDLPGGTTATIDLAGLRFIDTAAARILVQGSKRAAGRFRFLGRPAALARLSAWHGADEPVGTA